MNEHESKLLTRFLSCNSAHDLMEIKLAKKYSRFMLYPTNDLWLTAGQFSILKEFIKQIGEQGFYLTQFDGGKSFEGLFSKTNKVHCFDLECNYSFYHNINLYSVSVLFSTRGTWAILIDETFNAGFGIFLSCKEYVDRFKILYESVETEYKEWMDDKCYEEERKNCEKIVANIGLF